MLVGLRELPESQRIALLMRELAGHSYEEIADAARNRSERRPWVDRPGPCRSAGPPGRGRAAVRDGARRARRRARRPPPREDRPPAPEGLPRLPRLWRSPARRRSRAARPAPRLRSAARGRWCAAWRCRRQDDAARRGAHAGDGRLHGVGVRDRRHRAAVPPTVGSPPSAHAPAPRHPTSQARDGSAGTGPRPLARAAAHAARAGQTPSLALARRSARTSPPTSTSARQPGRRVAALGDRRRSVPGATGPPGRSRSGPGRSGIGAAPGQPPPPPPASSPSIAGAPGGSAEHIRSHAPIAAGGVFGAWANLALESWQRDPLLRDRFDRLPVGQLAAERR